MDSLFSDDARMFPCTEESVDAAVAECPNAPAVFLIRTREGQPYLARTALLRRRLSRLLGRRETPSKMLHLRAIAERVEYWPYASRLDSTLRLYELARRYFADDYARRIKLRQTAFLKLILTNPFPRTQISTRLSGSESLHFGPFPSRTAAEQFEAGFLDFFQIRRCQEDLAPSPEHPGCVYGEMSKCLRPCQEVVTIEEYASETRRVEQFLRTGGSSLLDSLTQSRDRFSAELEFEQAARMHKRLEKAAGVIQSKGELASDVTALHGVAVVPSPAPHTMLLWFLIGGTWRHRAVFPLAHDQAEPVPMDRRLRELAAALPQPAKGGLRERQEHLAILTGWFFSTYRDGEWIAVHDPRSLPYRRLVNAIHRVAKANW